MSRRTFFEGGFGLRKKISLLIVFALSIMAITTVVFIEITLTDNLRSELDEKGIILASHLSEMSIEPLLVDDIFGLHSNAKSIKKVSVEVVYVFILDKENNVVAHTFEEGFPLGLKEANTPLPGEDYSIQLLDTELEYIREIAMPIIVEDEVLGAVHIGLSETHTRQTIRETKQKLLGITAIITSVSIFLVLFLSLRIIRPLEELKKGVEDIGKGNMDQKIKVNTADEIGVLAEAFNKMAGDLKQDIDRRETVEKTLETYAEQLEEANRLKDLFTDIMRHDLMNPLQVIDISQHQLKEEKEKLSEEAQVYLKGLEDASGRAIKLVEDASTYGKLETLDKLDFETLDLLTIIKQALSGIKPIFGEDTSRIMITSLGKYSVRGDPKVTELVFTNLLSNAMKYSQKGTKVEVGITEDKDYYKVHVKDRGEGISNEYKQSIFNRYDRGERGGVRGTGLGLAIAKRIVELHEGRIWVEDNPKGGSIFYVSLPKG